MTDYTGPERRTNDALYMQVREDIAALRQAVEDNEKTTEGKIEELQRGQQQMIVIVERGKVVVWVLSGLGGALMWAESQWQVLTKFLRSMSG